MQAALLVLVIYYMGAFLLGGVLHYALFLGFLLIFMWDFFFCEWSMLKLTQNIFDMHVACSKIWKGRNTVVSQTRLYDEKLFIEKPPIIITTCARYLLRVSRGYWSVRPLAEG